MFCLNNLDKKRITNGRMFVYKQDTTELANVYTYENSEYVEAPNPIYFVDGIPNNTYFFENNIYDVVVQEYVGDSSDPSGDLRIEMWPESFSTKIGFQMEVGSNSNTHLTVHTLEGLRNTNVGENLYVDVIGYWTNNDCERRTYYWDATCVNIADGGLIVDSEVSDTGRWILICNEVMKSEYYGVYGNSHSENIGKLFSYNDQYGSMSLVSPKTIMLAPGNYGDGYTIYQGGGKHIIFQAGAHFVQGNTIRCLSYEGVDTIGNIQIGFNKDWQYSVEYRCNQTARFSNYYKLIDFLQSNAQCLIFDVEYNYDNPASNPKNHLNTIKTLTNVRCVFEKPFGFYWNSGEQAGGIIFDNCAIESDHKIRKPMGISFKNMRVTDRWFVNPWEVYPDPTDDVGCEYLTNDFEYADSYITYKLNNCGSAVVLDCYGQKLHNPKSIWADGLSSVEINGLRSKEYGVSMSIPSATFHDCSFNSAFIYSPFVSAFDSRFEHGYLTANGLNSNNRVYRHYERCFFGGWDSNSVLKTRHNIESATYVNLYVKDCNFENRHSPFISQNGCALGTNSLTYFYNNVGIGDGYCPTAFFNGANTRPVTIIEGLLTWTDEVGNQNWRNGKTTYKMAPWPSDGQVHRFDGSLGSQFGYDDIGTNSSGVYCVLSSDFIRHSDNKVYNFMQQTFSANFKPYGPEGPSYVAQLYNPWNSDMGKVVLNKTERA